MDRQNRASNGIIFNINESSKKKTQTKRWLDDQKTVNDALEGYDINITNLKILRWGKFDINM